MPAGKNSTFGGKTQQGDPTSMYRWAAKHGKSARVRKNNHLNEAERERATARFPKEEARREEARKARVLEGAKFMGEVDSLIKLLGELAEKEERNSGADKTDLQWYKFLHRCWKEVKYAATFQAGPLEHRDREKYMEEFVGSSQRPAPC